MIINTIIINKLEIYIGSIIFKYYIYTIKLSHIPIFYNKYQKAIYNVIQLGMRKVKNIDKGFLN